MTKFRYLAIAGLLTITSTCFGAPQCIPWDYARIKDAKENDLVQLACQSEQRAMENTKESMEAISSGGSNWKAESDAASHAREVCQDQELQAIRMLREKFGRKVTKSDCGAI